MGRIPKAEKERALQAILKDSIESKLLLDVAFQFFNLKIE